eukprot:6190268-Pleurochrysis_carterae.AAC.3
MLDTRSVATFFGFGARLLNTPRVFFSICENAKQCVRCVKQRVKGRGGDSRGLVRRDAIKDHSAPQRQGGLQGLAHRARKLVGITDRRPRGHASRVPWRPLLSLRPLPRSRAPEVRDSSESANSGHASSIDGC